MTLSPRKDYLPFGSPDFTQQEIDAVSRVMRAGWVGQGPETLAFEKELAQYLGAGEVVAVNSCTSALFLTLLVRGVGPGDEVIVPSLTWCSTVNVILHLGATPVFCDVARDTFCVTPETVLPHVTARTRAVMAVHFGGYAIDIAAMRGALPSSVTIVEDAAHALGARHADGVRVGAASAGACFSFYANKNLSTADGGAIALDDPELAERLRRLRMHGMASNAWARYVNPGVFAPAGLDDLGYKMNYTDLQAAIGRVQLARLDSMAATRAALAERYRALLAERVPGVVLQSGVTAPGHARHLVCGSFGPEVTGMPRDQFLLALRKRNIGASIHYAPLHVMPLYAAYRRDSLPATGWLCDRILTLPISARMTVEDVDEVCSHIVDIVGARSS